MAWYDYTPLGAAVKYGKKAWEGLEEDEPERPEFEKVDTGLEGGAEMREASRGYLGGIDTRGQYQIDPAQQAQMRSRQLGAAGRIMQTVGQRGPSIVDEQARQARESSMQQQMSLASSGRGNQALAAREAARAQAGATQGIAGQAMTGRLQEEQQARQRDLSALQAGAGIYSGARGQDIGFATSQAGLQAQQRAQADAARLAQQQFQAGLSQQELAARLQQQGTQAGFESGIYGADVRGDGQPGMQSQVIGAGLQAGAMALMSDEREKENISEGNGAIDRMLASLQAKEYNYKDSANGEGDKVGVMAQDLEKSEVGSRMVEENSEGKKMIKGEDFMGTTLASLARLNERLRKIEGE